MTEPLPGDPNVKTPLESGTIKAILLAAIALLGLFGAKAAAWAGYLGGQADVIVQGVMGVITVVGLIAAWRGRVNSNGEKIVSSQEKARLVNLSRGRVPPRDPFRGTPIILILISGLFTLITSGCTSRAEVAAMREGMVQADQPILDEHKEWAEALATDPKKLPNLFDNETQQDRDNWLRVRQSWHQEREQFLENSRKNDSK